MHLKKFQTNFDNFIIIYFQFFKYCLILLLKLYRNYNLSFLFIFLNFMSKQITKA